MATITKFEDLEIWQLSRVLNKEIFPFLQTLNDSRNYELQKQLDRSAGSIMDNIAEGFERDGNREFIQFLAISKASTVRFAPNYIELSIEILLKKKNLKNFKMIVS